MKALGYFSIAMAMATIADSYSQPTITSAGTVPRVGDVYVLTETDYTAPGSAGANQNWDFSALPSVTNKTVQYQTPSSTPHGASHTTSNLALNDDPDYYYMQSTSSALTVTGVFTSIISENVTFQNPQDLMRFPATYNMTYVDTFKAVFSFGGNPGKRTGTATVLVDGYGSLMLPGQTYTDVVRVKTTENSVDSIEFSTGFWTQVNQTATVRYEFFKEGINMQLLRIETSSSSSFGDDTIMYYNSTPGLAMAENSHFGSLSIDPNPALDNISLKWEGVSDEPLTVSIIAADGRVVWTGKADGAVSKNLDVRFLTAGVYIALLNNGGKVWSSRFVKIE
jgi:hypothetical protein